MRLSSTVSGSRTWLPRQNWAPHRHFHHVTSSPCIARKLPPQFAIGRGGIRRGLVSNKRFPSHLSSFSRPSPLSATVVHRTVASSSSFPPVATTLATPSPMGTKILKEPITRVTTSIAAQRVLQTLYAHPEVFWACDTEVADIDIKNQGPVGHGKVTCISVFGGPDIDFGLGEGPGSVLWIENIHESQGLLQEFKDWFQDEKYKKVWHNYGFDRHVMFNEGIDCRGFAGDTMHMARLWDTSLDKMEGAGGYSLASLSSLLLDKERLDKQAKDNEELGLSPGNVSKFMNSVPSSAYSNGAAATPPATASGSGTGAKESMMDLFGVAKLTKSGLPSKVKTLPSVWELQTDPLHRDRWIQYSAKDAVCTFQLHQKLTQFLSAQPWQVEVVDTATTTSSSEGVVDGGVIEVKNQGNMYMFYENYLRKFGELLTDMERNGIKVDVSGHLAQAEQRAREDRDRMQRLFVEWMGRYVKDAECVNVASTTQMQQLFFGHYKNMVLIDKSREFSMEKDAAVLESETASVVEQNRYAKWTAAQIKEELKARGMKGLSGKKAVLLERLLLDDADSEGRARSANSGASSVAALSNTSSHNGTVDSAGEYQNMDVQELQDICTSRRIPWQHLVPTDAVPPAAGGYGNDGIKDCLIGLISADMKQFLHPHLSTTVPSSPAVKFSASPHEGPLMSSSGQHCASAAPADMSTNTLSKEMNDVNLMEVAQLKVPKRQVNFTIDTFGMKPKEFTPAGVPRVGHAVLRGMSGSGLSFPASGEEPEDDDEDEGAVYGSAYKHFGGGQEGRDACRAIGALANVSQIETMINSFLVPLQALADEEGRIHCSLNLNTETGRLSSRKPNLQNQPALEKDQYKIRDAFVAEEGNTLLVADYGQLELRLMAHMTQCRSMLEAFRSGGCFHSRTAVGMYPHIQEAIARGEVLLEWDYSKGAPPKPLVKDVYGSERRKAKTLNFSIAYGKTIHGLAKDWGISPEEAKETLEAWYRDRPEVREWQENTREMARREGFVRTMMGRRRNLKEANTKGAAGSHALRAAINTPIQGSAADVVMMAMIHLGESLELRRIGWKLLLQIHDEVILEGPRENKDLAMAEVMRCMQAPFDGVGFLPLSVKLEVDAKTADTWYQAK